MAQGFNPNEPVTGGTTLGNLYSVLRRLFLALFTLHCGDEDPSDLAEGAPYMRRITGGHALRYYDGTTKRPIGDAIEELVAARGTGASLAARLDSALNPDGTIKNPAPSGGWWNAMAGQVYASASTFTVTGDQREVFTVKRPVRLQASDLTYSTGYVTAVAYSSGTGLTTVTVDCAVPSPLNKAEYGQEVANAPLPGTTTSTPTPTGSSSANEGTVVNITVSNYDADATYTASVTGGTLGAPTAGVYPWTLPTVSADTAYSFSIFATKPGELRSATAAKSVTVLNVPIQDGPTISLTDSTDGWPDASFSGGSFALVSGGAHSVGVDNTNGRQFVSATPEFVEVPVEFTVSGGSASSPEVQHAQSGMISEGDELWFKPTGSNDLEAVTVGGVSTSGGTSSAAPGSGASDKHANVTVSTNTVSTSVADNSYRSGRILPSVSSGWEYFEILVNQASYGGYNDSIGFAATGRDFTSASSVVGFNSGEAAWPTYGQYIKDGNWSGSPGTYTNGDVIMIARNGSGDVWFGKNGTWLNSGNPATGENPSLTGVTGEKYIAYTLSHQNASLTFRFSPGSWSYSAPSGFGAVAVSATTYTLSSLSPSQSSLPDKVIKLRATSSQGLMAVARGTTGQNFSDGDFTNASSVASAVYAAGPLVTVTGEKITFGNDATKVRLALKLMGTTALGCRAKQAKIYTEEMAA